MKKVFSAIFIILLLSAACYPQEKPTITNRDFSIYGVVISAKGGIMSGDKFLNKNNIDFSSHEIPPGAVVEITAEYPLGKYFYGCLSLNGWYSKDKFFNDSSMSDVTRKAYGLNFSPLIKYRLLYRRVSLTVSAGIGRSLVITKYSQSGHDYNTDMTNLCANIGGDFFLDNGIFFSAEGSYYYLFGGFDPSGIDRTNQMFLGKIGIGYIFKMKARR
jgi:hypothetical protein